MGDLIEGGAFGGRNHREENAEKQKKWEGTDSAAVCEKDLRGGLECYITGVLDLLLLSLSLF